MAALALPIIFQKICQPFAANAIFLDLFYTIGLHIWIIIELKLGELGRMTIRDKILETRRAKNMKAFCRLRYILTNGENPDGYYNLKAVMETPKTIIEESYADRQKRLLKKV